MADPDPIRGAGHRPFTEQVAFFRQKLERLVPTQRWDDLLREEHDRAFMVAGAAKADLLTDLAAAVDKAITEGGGIEEFRQDFRSIVRRNGWTGWAGEGSTKGEAWRVGVIYRTNMATSYAAGRHAQLVAGNFPFWVYRHGGSEHPRLHHLELDGLVLPSDHPAWAKLYPPSDWGCSCYVVGARSERGAVRLGGDLAKKLPADWTRFLGEGWDYAPGATVTETINAMAGKIGKWDHLITKAFTAILPAARADELAVAYRALPSTADQVRRYAQRVENPEPGGVELRPLPPVRTLGGVTSAQAERIGATKPGLDVSGFDFVIAEDLTRHILQRHGRRSQDGLPVTTDEFALLPSLIEQGSIAEGWDSPQGNLKRVVIRARIEGREYETVWEARGGRRSLYLKTFYVTRDLRKHR